MYVFKENHALVLFLFSSRHWFLALFSLANQSSTKKIKISSGGKKRILRTNQSVFKLKPAFGMEADTVDSAVYTDTPNK